ncbi:hypothetical protein Tco_0383139 [Tanacetum coccineum]
MAKITFCYNMALTILSILSKFKNSPDAGFIPSGDNEKKVTEEPKKELREVLQALVDGKKIVVTEASVIRDLQLDDEEGTDYLPNATIFEELTRMGSARVVSSDEASLGDQEDASKQGRKIDNINADTGITLNSTHFDADTYMFGVHDLDSDEVVVESEVAAKKKDDEVNVVEEVVSAAEETVNAATIHRDEITLAQAMRLEMCKT